RVVRGQLSGVQQSKTTTRNQEPETRNQTAYCLLRTAYCHRRDNIFLPTMASFDVVIVGGGIMGAFAAGELGGQGATVALLDQSVLPNPNAASVDHSKVFRFAYPDQFYVRLAVDSLKGWRNLENECDLTLLLTSGVILLSTGEGSFESDTYHALKSCGLETQLLDAQQTSTRFPQFDTSGTTFSVFDPSGAVLLAEKSLRAALDVAINRGVRIFEHSRVIELRSSRGSVELRTEQGDNLVCAKAIAAAGPWTRLLLPELNKRLTTTHQDVAYFEPAADRAASFEPNEFPIFIELESGFYGFPIHHDGAMKIANHHKGAVADPDTDKEGVADGFVDDCRAFFRKS